MRKVGLLRPRGDCLERFGNNTLLRGRLRVVIVLRMQYVVLCFLAIDTIFLPENHYLHREGISKVAVIGVTTDRLRSVFQQAHSRVPHRPLG